MKKENTKYYLEQKISPKNKGIGNEEGTHKKEKDEIS